ncbi:MAG: hypothetical protein LBP98_09225 [Tannerella sp.]|jgi:hypothetical protein|nr:hypothetical protein [Tannerella sp.]
MAWEKPAWKTASDMEELEEEIRAIREMPEEKVCILYNVDSREDIVGMINEELDFLKSGYEEAEMEEEEHQWCDDEHEHYMEWLERHRERFGFPNRGTAGTTGTAGTERPTAEIGY